MVALTSFSRCLLAAVAGNSSLVAFPTTLGYSSVVDPYNLAVPVTPAAVVFPQNASQVAAAVKCARNSGVKVQAKSGGHSYGNYGSSTGEVSVNLKNLQEFSLDSATGLATIGAGTLLGDVNERLFNAGMRYFPHGTAFGVGIGGHATVGGVGPASRMAGMALDHVEEVEVVLANSTILRASGMQNTDLFFAVRGAGASFGIVTEFKFRTGPAPKSIVNYAYEWTAADSASRAQVLKSWQTWITGAQALPFELSSTLTVTPTAIVISGGYFGTADDFEALNFVSHFPPPQASSAPVYTSYREVSESWNAELVAVGQAEPQYLYGKSLAFRQETLISNKTLDRVMTYLDTTSNGTQNWLVNFELGGGVIAEVAPTATAFPHRDAVFLMLSYARGAKSLSPTTVNFLNGLNRIITSDHPTAYFGEYAGDVDPRQDDAKARNGYWDGNYKRLQQIKSSVDPLDFIHNKQSVRPL